MFNLARRRLTLLYIGLFTLVLGVFSLAFYLVLATVLQPNFDLGPETTNEQAAEIAYNSAIEQIGLALLAADGVALLVVGISSSFLARRTLRPIREAHERQRRFVADASHEMRTPLASIQSSAESALASPAPAETERALHAIADATARLGRLTADLLVLARSEDGLVERPSESVDLSVVVAEAIDVVRRTADPAPTGRDGNLPHIEVELATDLVLRANANEVGQIVMNLVDNALRYTPAAGQVTVRTSGTDHDATVEVADTGPGIAAADLERIFEPFYRVHASADAPPGNGLGLAIAKGLAHRNGGRVTATSRVGSGSTFRLTLPRSG